MRDDPYEESLDRADRQAQHQHQFNLDDILSSEGDECDHPVMELLNAPEEDTAAMLERFLGSLAARMEGEDLSDEIVQYLKRSLGVDTASTDDGTV